MKGLSARGIVIKPIVMGAAFVAVGIVILIFMVFPRLAQRLQFGERPLCPDQSDLPVTTAGQWAHGAPIPTLRGETHTVALEGMIYFVGGLMSAWEVSPAVEAYDPATNTWPAVASLPSGINHPGLTAYDGRIYITGGYNAKEFASIASDGWVYNPALDR